MEISEQQRIPGADRDMVCCSRTLQKKCIFVCVWEKKRTFISINVLDDFYLFYKFSSSLQKGR